MNKSFLKYLYFVALFFVNMIGILLICQPAQCQKSYLNSEGHFEFKIPVNWEQIPLNIIRQKKGTIDGKFESKMLEDYITGFQYSNSDSWLAVPYILISINKVGLVSAKEIKQKVHSESKILKYMTFSEGENILKYVKEMNFGEVYFDSLEGNVIEPMVQKKNSDTYAVKLTKLTSYGYVNLYYLCKNGTWIDNYKNFKLVEENLIIEPKFSYSNIRGTDNRPKWRRFLSNEFKTSIDISYPIANYLFTIVPIVILLLVFSRHSPIKEFIKPKLDHNFTFALVLNFISLVIQYIVASFTLFPAILCFALVYPLGRLLAQLR